MDMSRRGAYEPLIDSDERSPSAVATVALPLDPALFQPTSRGNDGIGFSEDTLRKVARRPVFEDSFNVHTCRCCHEKLVLLCKRHCAMCGRVCCLSCTTYRLDLSNLGYDRPPRVCNTCFAGSGLQ